MELPSLHGLGGCPQSPVPVCLPSALFSHPQVVELPSLHEAFGGKGDPARLSAACLCAPRVHTFSSPVAGPLHSAFFFWFRRWCVKGFFFLVAVGRVCGALSLASPRFRLSIDVVLSPCVHSGRRPKPRQARDGHSWRMAAALLVLPAGPASVLPTFDWWCVEGRGAVSPARAL